MPAVFDAVFIFSRCFTGDDKEQGKSREKEGVIISFHILMILPRLPASNPFFLDRKFGRYKKIFLPGWPGLSFLFYSLSNNPEKGYVMFLKSMDLFGFKSFAERTHFEFDSGVTAIVGPNGCGKSNVVDAIKWVLGEKQARNIRGEKMEDIIFSGTELRKPLSLSEVSITINNQDRVLDIESDTVTVSRRVFRDGESEYMINKSPVRLKDIEKLFLDTGIGKSAYSVMEQGKMDLILSTRAEDRRYIFEEAAGISRYKLQKRESLKKLKDTGENLERLNDIIHEIEREKEIKAKQAEKTREYLKLRDEMREIDVAQQVIKYREIVSRQTRLQEDLDRLNAERERVAVRVNTASAENEKDDKRKNDIQLELFDNEKKLHAFRIRVEDIDVKTERNRKSIEEHRVRIEAVEKQVTERNNRLKELQKERERSESQGVEIAGRIEKDRQRLEELFTTRKEKIQSIHQSRDVMERNRQTVEETERHLRSLREELAAVVKKLIDAIDRRKAELLDSEMERQEVRDRIEKRLEELTIALNSARLALSGGRTEEALEGLNSLDIPGLREDIVTFEGYEDGFRSILFDKSGVHAEKEKLDLNIGAADEKIEELRRKNSELEQFIQSEQAEMERVNDMITRIEKDLSRDENERQWIERNLKTLDHRIRDVTMQLENHHKEIERSTGAIEGLEKEISEWEARLVDYGKQSDLLEKSISGLVSRRAEIDKKIDERRKKNRRDEEELARLQERITNQDRSHVELIFKRNAIEDYLWTEYELKAASTERLSVSASRLPDLNERMTDVKKKIQNLGPINNLAIEEYRDLKKRFEYYLSQKEDIEKAREDILSVIEDINQTSVQLFMETFNEIQKNFSELFRRLFEGGEAKLALLNEEDILESGIEITVRPPGKKLKSIDLLSGGERALTAIALLFATYMAKPSPFCFLDEIDAPLDEQNIGRFVKMMREFARGTQFIIVTHNKKTMSIAESIYGVTMEEPGVSSLASLRMERLEKAT